jgi:hypothetical protein
VRYSFIVAILLAGCPEHGRSDGTPLADAPEGEVCLATFEASLQKSCMQPSDCVAVSHNDCCGLVFLGVRVDSLDAFSAAENELRKCAPCPPLGCAHQDQAEDGKVVTVSSQHIVPICVMNRCSSTVQ